MSGSWSMYLLLLAAFVLLASGVLKLSDRVAAAAAVESFDVLPGPVKALAKTALPVVEVALGVLLLLASGWLLHLATWLTVALMLAFTVLVGVTLARGERPSCHCFGAVSEEPISIWTLARNVALLALTGAVALGVAPDQGLAPAVADATADARSGLLLMVLITAAVIVLWVRQERLLRMVGASGASPEQLGANPAQPASLAAQDIPEAVLFGPDNALPVQLVEMARDQARLLVFVSPTCSACHALVPLVPQWQEFLGGEVEVTMVSIGEKEDTAAAYPDQIEEMWFDTERAHETLGVPGTPSAVLLGTNAQIGAGPAAGTQAIGELMATIVEAVGVNLLTGNAQHSQVHAQQSATREDNSNWMPAEGNQVADLTVVTEAGRVASYAEALAEIAGDGPVTTVAWRHDCGYCEEIVDEMREASDRGDVVLVISEDIATVRAQGMTGPALQVMPPGNAVGAVGVPGTPAAVPVRDGVVVGVGGIGGPHTLEVIAEYAGHGADA